MQLTVNTEKFDELQALFIREVIDKVRIKLEEAGIKGLEMEEITGSIAFSIASTIDDTSGVEVDGVEVELGFGDPQLPGTGWSQQATAVWTSPVPSVARADSMPRNPSTLAASSSIFPLPTK